MMGNHGETTNNISQKLFVLHKKKILPQMCYCLKLKAKEGNYRITHNATKEKKAIIEKIFHDMLYGP